MIRRQIHESTKRQHEAWIKHIDENKLFKNIQNNTILDVLKIDEEDQENLWESKKRRFSENLNNKDVLKPFVSSMHLNLKFPLRGSELSSFEDIATRTDDTIKSEDNEHIEIKSIKEGDQSLAFGEVNKNEENFKHSETMKTLESLIEVGVLSQEVDSIPLNKDSSLNETILHSPKSVEVDDKGLDQRNSLEEIQQLSHELEEIELNKEERLRERQINLVSKSPQGFFDQRSKNEQQNRRKGNNKIKRFLLAFCLIIFSLLIFVLGAALYLA